jgi:hypothetical protein
MVRERAATADCGRPGDRPRCRRHDPPEVLAEGRHGAEASARGYALDGVGASLEQHLGAAHPGLDEPAQRRGARLLAKAAAQRPDTQRGAARDLTQRELALQVLLEPRKERPERDAVRRGRRVNDELGLAAVALERNDRRSSGSHRHLGAVVAAHHVQTQIERGGGAGRGQHPALVHVQDVGVHLDRRVAAEGVSGREPVSGGAGAGEQSIAASGGAAARWKRRASPPPYGSTVTPAARRRVGQPGAG